MRVRVRVRVHVFMYASILNRNKILSRTASSNSAREAINKISTRERQILNEKPFH